MSWIREIEAAQNIDDFRTSHSTTGEKHKPNLKMLDAKIATALKILTITNFRKKVYLEEQKAQKDNRFPRRRQIANMIYEYFRIMGNNASVLELSDLMSIAFRGDDRCSRI